MVNGLHLYSAFTHPKATKALFIQLGLGVLPMETSTLDQVEPEIKPPTFWFVDNLHEPLSHCRALTPVCGTDSGAYNV